MLMGSCQQHQNRQNPDSKKPQPTRVRGHTLSKGGVSVAVHLMIKHIMIGLTILMISYQHKTWQGCWNLNLSIDCLQSSSSAVGWVVLPTLFPASETSSSLSVPPTTLSTINIVTENLIIVMIIIFTAVTLLCHDHERMVSSLNKPFTTFLSKPWPSQSSWSSGVTRSSPWEISSGSILYANWILGANHHTCFDDCDDESLMTISDGVDDDVIDDVIVDNDDDNLANAAMAASRSPSSGSSSSPPSTLHIIRWSPCTSSTSTSPCKSSSSLSSTTPWTSSSTSLSSLSK